MLQRAPSSIGPHEIAADTRAVVHLPVSVFPDDTPLTLAVEVIHGRQDGPIVFVSAGVHGVGVIVGGAILSVVNEGDAIYHLGRISAHGAVLPTAPDPVFDEDEII